MIRKLLMTLMVALGMGAAMQAQTNYATVSPVTATAGSKKVDMSVNLINESQLTAFWFTLQLPEGFDLKYSSVTESYSVNLTDRGYHHSATVSKHDDGNYGIGVVSLSGKNFININEDEEKLNALMTLTLTASSYVQEGFHYGKLTNVNASENITVNGQTTTVTVPMPDVDFTILVKGDGSVVTLNVTSAGVATLMLPFDAAVPEGLEAWRCEEIDGGVVKARKQAAINANTPLLITGTQGEYTFNGTPSYAQQQYTAGVLTGTYKPLNAKSGYVLQKHGDDVAFYTIDAVDGENILPYRCYIAGSGASSVRMLRIQELETGIDRVSANGEENAYDLSGRRVNARHAKGITIVNNTKILKR